MQRGQLGSALGAAWAVVSLVFALIVAASAVLPADVAVGIAARCQRPVHAGRSCPLCGMTHAFLAVSRGRWREANAANPGGLPLYAAMLGNQAALAAVAFRRRRVREGTC
jgi:hypothetical protein